MARVRDSIARRLKRYSRRGGREIDATSSEVLAKVWGLRGYQELAGTRPYVYVDHYNNLASIALPLNIFNNYKHSLELVDTVRNDTSAKISDLIKSVQRASSSWARTAFDHTEAVRALQFATGLWLFCSPDLSNSSSTLAEATKTHLEKSFSSSSTHTSVPATGAVASTGLLSSDFSANSLTRKGGFYLIWTSDLAEHLTFVSKDQLRIFRHALILQKYQREQESTCYPDGFLEETYRTINLLFPFEDYKTSKRVKRIARREHVDLEAAMTEKAIEEHHKFQVASYKYYASRLVEIQRRYDLARPHRLSQWWYDRRQRPEWAALMVALIVFLLTVLFGIAQVVTGVLQVIASSH